jgi:hypothetical protein
VVGRWEKELASALASAPVSKALSNLGIAASKLPGAQTQGFMVDDQAGADRQSMVSRPFGEHGRRQPSSGFRSQPCSTSGAGAIW